MVTSKIKLIELKDYPDYFAGSDGIIYSKRPVGRGKMGTLHPLKSNLRGKRSYGFIGIRNKFGVFTSKDVHPLICEAYHGKKPTPKHWVAHLDGNSHNNVPSNLKWKTPSENHKDKLIHGTHDRGVNNSRALINAEQLKEIRNLLTTRNFTHKEIGLKFNVSRLFITKIANGYRYKEVNL